MSKEMQVEEMKQLKEDSIQIRNDIAGLYNVIEMFKKKYQSQHLLGEAVMTRLDDDCIRWIESGMNSFKEMERLFDSISKITDAQIERMENMPDESLLKRFKC